MRGTKGADGRPRWGVVFPVILLCNHAVIADPTTVVIPDPEPRSNPGVVPATHPPDSDDLDGTYVWLGPSAAGGYTDGSWDSLLGGELAIVRVREHADLGAIGASLGGAKWTVRDGGRAWLDGLVGTELLGHMVGASAGPLVEFAEFRHPRFGGSVGVWGFAGIAPYGRVGYVDGVGAFVELGIQFALPVFRR